MTAALPAMSRDDVLNLPAVVDVPTAGRALDMGRKKSYELARQGEFPVPVLRVGGKYRVRAADLMTFLGIEPAAARNTLDTPA